MILSNSANNLLISFSRLLMVLDLPFEKDMVAFLLGPRIIVCLECCCAFSEGKDIIPVSFPYIHHLQEEHC